MLTDEAGSTPVPDTPVSGIPVPGSAARPGGRAEVPAPDPGIIPAPDPGVVDNARVRIAAQFAAGQFPGEMPAYPVDDLRAISAVIDAARDDAEHPADALDVGAALVVLCNLRLRLDRLELSLLDAAQGVGLGWDVIAAIVGIPASAAQERHIALGTRPDPQ
jgi:hypothetical protein